VHACHQQVLDNPLLPFRNVKYHSDFEPRSALYINMFEITEIPSKMQSLNASLSYFSSRVKTWGEQETGLCEEAA
jgi:hypothetical protein